MKEFSIEGKQNGAARLQVVRGTCAELQNFTSMPFNLFWGFLNKTCQFTKGNKNTDLFLFSPLHYFTITL